MSVRPATAADLADVAAMERTLFGVDAWTEEQVAEEVQGDHRRAWVVGDPVVSPAVDSVVGYAVTRTVGDVADLQRIAVRPEHRRRGLAHELLAAACAAARGDGAVRMLLEVSAGNPGAVAFYGAEGFAEIDRRRRYYRDGSDALVLERPLPAAGDLPSP